MIGPLVLSPDPGPPLCPVCASPMELVEGPTCPWCDRHLLYCCPWCHFHGFKKKSPGITAGGR